MYLSYMVYGTAVAFAVMGSTPHIFSLDITKMGADRKSVGKIKISIEFGVSQRQCECNPRGWCRRVPSQSEPLGGVVIGGESVKRRKSSFLCIFHIWYTGQLLLSQ